jgi:hypothetical protein
MQIDDLSIYRPSPSWFAHNPFGIHGIGHAARVFVWANLIAQRLRQDNGTLDLEAVRWTAVLHDVGRLSDGWDKGHGTRSAKWVAGHRGKLPVVLEDEVIDKVLYCCRWHETSDKDIPLMTPELMCMKDADGLDRVRIYDLDPSYLRSDPAHLLVDAAWKLYYATESAEDPWEAAIRATKGIIPSFDGATDPTPVRERR